MASSNINAHTTSEQQVLQRISVLEDRLREYEANRPSAMMQFGPGDARLFDVLREEEAQTTAFRRLIYAEKQALQGIRVAEKERLRVHAVASSQRPNGLSEFYIKQLTTQFERVKRNNESRCTTGIKVAEPPSLRGGSWTFLGHEGTTHVLPIGAHIRYGVEGRWIQKKVEFSEPAPQGTASVIAGNETFERDPAPGVEKTLMVWRNLAGEIISNFRVVQHPNGIEEWVRYTKKCISCKDKKLEFHYKLDGETEWITAAELENPY